MGLPRHCSCAARCAFWGLRLLPLVRGPPKSSSSSSSSESNEQYPPPSFTARRGALETTPPRRGMTPACLPARSATEKCQSGEGYPLRTAAASPAATLLDALSESEQVFGNRGEIRSSCWYFRHLFVIFWRAPNRAAVRPVFAKFWPQSAQAPTTRLLLSVKDPGRDSST
jgi:hypothetical protein